MFAKRIAELRRAAGLTQAELADRMGGGMTQSHLSALERGSYQHPDMETLRRLAAALRLTIRLTITARGVRME